MHFYITPPESGFFRRNPPDLLRLWWSSKNPPEFDELLKLAIIQKSPQQNANSESGIVGQDFSANL